MSLASVPPPSAWRARVGHGVGAVLFRTAWRGQRVDAHLVPRSGPVLVVANHLGFLDGPFVFAMVPRRAHFIIKKQTFSGPMGALMEGVGQIPLDRSVADRTALGSALAVLRGGGAVGMFPEGTRGRGDVRAIHGGAAWLALQIGCPVVPVACLGTRTTGDGRSAIPPVRGRLVAVFGAPVVLEPDPGLPGRDRRRQATEQLRVALHDHVMASVARTGIPLPDDELPPAPDAER